MRVRKAELSKKIRSTSHNAPYWKASIRMNPSHGQNKRAEQWPSSFPPTPQKIILLLWILHWVTVVAMGIHGANFQLQEVQLTQRSSCMLWNPSSRMHEGHVSHRLLPANNWAQLGTLGRHGTPFRHGNWLWLKDSPVALLKLPWMAWQSCTFPSKLPSLSPSLRVNVALWSRGSPSLPGSFSFFSRRCFPCRNLCTLISSWHLLLREPRLTQHIGRSTNYTCA